MSDYFFEKKIDLVILCELAMNPDEKQIPNAINKRNAHGKSIPTDFEDMYPFLPRNELNSNNLN